MKLSAGPEVSPATGEHAELFVLTTGSNQPCVLDGYPHVTLSGPAGTLPFIYARGGGYVTPERPHGFTIVSGGRAYFLVAKYRCDGGNLGTATLIRAALPGSPKALVLDLRGRGVSEFDYCRRYPGDQRVDPGNRVAVSPFETTLEAALDLPRPIMHRADARVTGVFQSCIAQAPCRPIQGYVEVQDSRHRVVARQRVDGRYTFALVPGKYMLIGQELTRCTDKGHPCLFNHPATAIAYYVAHVNIGIYAP
jgi:hypothetical protein